SIAERLPHLLHREVHALFKIDERVVRPEGGLDLFPRDQRAWLRGQQAKQLERLGLQADLTAALEQTFGLEIELESTKAHDRWPVRAVHRVACARLAEDLCEGGSSAYH